MRPVILVFTIGKCKTMCWCILDLIGREYAKLKLNKSAHQASLPIAFFNRCPN